MGLRTLVIPMSVVVFSCVACDHTRGPEPAVASSAKKEAAVVKASPNLAVSDDLAAECKLQLSSIEKAPKFDFDRAELSPEDKSVLDSVATCITTGPLKGRSLRLIGHTDKRGEAEYNLTLGDKRAHAAKSYLTHRGVADGRLGETSRGELDASGNDEHSFGVDRRVDILLEN